MYALKLEKPIAPLIIPSVRAVRDSKIELLGSDEEIKWHQESDNIVIEELPGQLPCDFAWSFKIRVIQ